MTIQDHVTKHLVDNGLWPAEVESVIAQYLESMAGESMVARMNDDMEGYPKQLLAVVLIGVRSEAIIWIDANKPKHFARRLLSDAPTEAGETHDT